MHDPGDIRTHNLSDDFFLLGGGGVVPTTAPLYLIRERPFNLSNRIIFKKINFQILRTNKDN